MALDVQQSMKCFTWNTVAACAGNSKLVIQSLTVRDATGALGAAAGTEAGMILTPWNPDESWTHDALVQVGTVPLLYKA